MENSIRLSIEIIFTETENGKPMHEHDRAKIAESVLNALVNEVDRGNGLAPEDAEYTTEHICVNDYMTGGREYRFIHSF